MAYRALGIVGLIASTVVVLLLVYGGGQAASWPAADALSAASIQPVAAVPAGSGTVRLTAAGDHGGSNSRGGQTLNLVASLAPAAHLALGDLSYSDLTPESAWCDWVVNGDAAAGVSGVGAIPVQLVGGNHEEDSRSDGFIRNFAACLPDRLGAVGDYGVEYYTDIGGLVRVVMIAADVTIDGEHYDYDGGAHRQWLEQAVTSARAAGIPWVVVGMHKVCVTTATKTCEVGESVMDWLLAPGHADLILQGHDHGVQRTHQLSCVDVNTSTPECIVDTDNNHSQGVGGVVLVGGSFGRSSYSQNPNDSESGYFAAWMSDESSPADEQQGVWQLDFSSTNIAGRWVGSTSSYTDAFSISRRESVDPAGSGGEKPGGDGETSGSSDGNGADMIAPRVGIKLISHRLTAAGEARVRLRCPANEQSSPCSGTLKLKTNELLPDSRQPAAVLKSRRLSLGARRFEMAAGTNRDLAVRIPRRNRGLVSAESGLRVRAIVTARDAAGNRKRIRKLLRLRGGAAAR